MQRPLQVTVLQDHDIRQAGGQTRRRDLLTAVTRQQRGPMPTVAADFRVGLRQVTGSSTVHIPKCLQE